MNRSARTELARQTISIVERGGYQSAGGRLVDIAQPIRTCLDATRHFSPEELASLRTAALASPAEGFATKFEIVNETTLAGIARVLADGSGPVAALNFASAKNPGGGFLNGSQAQEESLARSSALHASLLSLAGVLMSLYPAATVLLAIVVLRERVTRWQSVGMVLALAAVAMIAAG